MRSPESSRLVATLGALVLLGSLHGCHGEQPQPTEPVVAASCPPPFVSDGRGGCDPILPKDPCPDGTMAAPGDTACRAVGVASAPACPSGKMAVPGETTCREIAACGTGTWGDIASDAATLFVDRTYAGGGGDGSSARPFTTIQAAITAATVGTTVAIAAGSYVENLSISKAVHLRGRCASMVEVRGASASVATIRVGGPFSIELRDLAVTGPGIGVEAAAGAILAARQLWVHDLGDVGLQAYARSTISLQGSLFDRCTKTGLHVEGTSLTVEGTVVRDTQPRADKQLGSGIYAAVHSGTGVASSLVVRGALVDHNMESGIIAFGAKTTVENSQVRNTQPSALDHAYGVGIQVDIDPATRTAPSELVVRGSRIDGNSLAGIYISGSKATVATTVVADTVPPPADDIGGLGLMAFVDLGTRQPAEVLVSDSLFQNNTSAGIYNLGSVMTVDGCVVRGTRPQVKDQRGGNGIAALRDYNASRRTAVLEVHRSLIEGNVEAGISVQGTKATIDATVVRDTKPRALDGLFGDGIHARADRYMDPSETSLTITASLIQRSARAGVSVFGCGLSIDGTLLTCNGLDIDFESIDFGGTTGGASLTVGDANACGCTVDDFKPCWPLSSGLAPVPPPAPPPTI